MELSVFNRTGLFVPDSLPQFSFKVAHDENADLSRAPPSDLNLNISPSFEIKDKCGFRKEKNLSRLIFSFYCLLKIVFLFIIRCGRASSTHSSGSQTTEVHP